MNTTVALPWGPVLTLTAGVAAYVVASHAIPALVRVALGELDYRASDLGTLVSWRR